MDIRGSVIFIILSLLLQSGCSNIQAYMGVPLPSDQVAVIKNQDGFFSMRRVALHKIDNMNPDYGRGFFDKFGSGMTSGTSYEVLPGPHLLEIVIYLMSGEPSLDGFVPPYPCKKTFDLEAGHIYQISGNWSKNAYKISLIDQNNKKEMECIKYPYS